MSNVQVGPVKIEELQDIAELEQKVELEGPASFELIKARFSMFADGFLAARINSQIIGYAQTCLWDEELPSFSSDLNFFSDRFNDKGETLYIIFIGVLPEFQRQGVASKLIRALQTLAGNMGVEKVHVVTWDYLVNLYVKQGFVSKIKMPGFLPEGEFTLLEYRPLVVSPATI